jgi:hypothetical protein
MTPLSICDSGMRLISRHAARPVACGQCRCRPCRPESATGGASFECMLRRCIGRACCEYCRPAGCDAQSGARCRPHYGVGPTYGDLDAGGKLASIFLIPPHDAVALGLHTSGPQTAAALGAVPTYAASRFIPLAPSRDYARTDRQPLILAERSTAALHALTHEPSRGAGVAWG